MTEERVHDVEKAEAKEQGLKGTHMRQPSIESQELTPASEKTTNDGSSDGPDLDHEEVEEIDTGHQEDLRRKYSTSSIKAGPRAIPTGGDDLTRAATKTSNRSARSRISRIATNLTGRSKKKERLEREIFPESDLANGIVGWEGQDDPEMPLNFAPGRKYMLLGLLASITFLAPLASSLFAPGVSYMDAEFGNDSVILSAFAVTIFVLGFAIGPLFLSPLSEIYGRRVVLGSANYFFVAWQIGCALAPNLGSLIVFRFLAGVGGSGCLTIGGGVIADLFPPDQRGFASSIYSIGPLFGPVIEPIAGGFLAQRVGWRWDYWLLLIATGVVATGIECLNRETNPRVLMRWKVKRLSKELDRTDLHSCYDAVPGQSRAKASRILLNGLLRPIKMLCLSPIVCLLSIYMSVIYGLLYLLFTTIPQVFQTTYGWQPELTGLAYIGIGLGFFCGLATVAKFSDTTVVKMTKANDGVFEPEMRLPACAYFGCFIPISFFWYGWAADKGVHYMVPIIGLVPFGFGMMGIFIPIQTYLIDSFPEYAASAVAALTVSRSLFGALLPLAAPSMYEALGLGWGNSLLGFIAIALIPVPAAIYKYGGRIRKGHPIKL